MARLPRRPRVGVPGPCRAGVRPRGRHRGSPDRRYRRRGRRGLQPGHRHRAGPQLSSVPPDFVPLDFLDLPPRSVKPRWAGLTHVIDPGAGVVATQDLLSSAAPYIDIWKIGWGTAYVDPT